MFIFFSSSVLLLREKSPKVSVLVELFFQQSHWAAFTTSASLLRPGQDLVASVSEIKGEEGPQGPSVSSLMEYPLLSSGCLWQIEKLIAK